MGLIGSYKSVLVTVRLSVLNVEFTPILISTPSVAMTEPVTKAMTKAIDANSLLSFIKAMITEIRKKTTRIIMNDICIFLYLN